MTTKPTSKSLAKLRAAAEASISADAAYEELEEDNSQVGLDAFRRMRDAHILFRDWASEGLVLALLNEIDRLRESERTRCCEHCRRMNMGVSA